MGSFLLLLALATLSTQSRAQSSPAAAQIEVDASETAHYKIPRTIYGTFLEPIGHSIYGGLWAQELENPSFEDNLWSASQIRRMVEQEPELAKASDLGLPLPWEPLIPDQGMRYEPRWNDAANSFRSLLVMAVPGRQSGVRQRVYLPVHRVLRYTGSFYARSLSGPTEVEVSLRRREHPETAFARARVAVTGSSWARYEFALSLEPGQVAPLEPADFALGISNEARVLFDQALLFPADQVQGMDPDVVAMARALKTPLVRYGGNFTSGYHWRDGIGPMDKRVTMLNQAWGMPEYNQFGTDEFLSFCKLIGAEPQIALNLGSGTPQEAADWVRYVDEHWGKSGLLWELGNELYGRWQIGYPTLERAAARMKAFSEAVRAADPKARLIATGGDPDQFRDWNGSLLAQAPGAYDFLSTHFVVGVGRVRRANATPGFVAQAAFALPVGLERKLREMKAQIDANPQARGRVGIAFTEWLFHCSNNGIPCFNNMGGAICTARLLNTFMRVADFTQISDMTGLLEFGGIWKKRGQVYGVPAYWALRMYSNEDASVPVATRTTGASYDVQQGNTRIPDIPEVPYLDVFGALNGQGNKLVLFCVNRHLQSDVSARIHLRGFRARGSARVKTLASGGIQQQNDEAHPDAVRPVETTVEVRSPEFEYTFPHTSVTVLELERQ